MTKQSSDHPNSDRKKQDREQNAEGADRLDWAVVRHVEDAEDVQNKKQSYGDPDGKNSLMREDAPAKNEIGVREKLHRGGNFKKAHDHLHRVHPAAGARQIRNDLGRQGKNEEGNGKDS